MDPNLFHLVWKRVTEVLTVGGVLSFILEEGLRLEF